MLLGAFAKVRRKERVLDLGCGVGVLAIMALLRNPGCTACGLEITPGAAELARQNLELCGLSDRGGIVCGDMRDMPRGLIGRFDVCISNPPYFHPERGLSSPSAAMAAARNQSCGGISDVCVAAASCLKWGGRFYLCYPPGDLSPLFASLLQNRLEPKTMRLVFPTEGSRPCLVLLEARKGGGVHLDILPSLIIEKDGQKTSEFKKMYTLED